MVMFLVIIIILYIDYFTKIDTNTNTNLILNETRKFNNACLKCNFIMTKFILLKHLIMFYVIDPFCVHNDYFEKYFLLSIVIKL